MMQFFLTCFLCATLSLHAFITQRTLIQEIENLYPGDVDFPTSLANILEQFHSQESILKESDLEDELYCSLEEASNFIQIGLPADALPYIEHAKWLCMLTKEERKTIRPYLLPANHPAKPALDQIFTQPFQVLKNKDTFRQAGFQFVVTRPEQFIQIGKHPSLPGYLVKAYLDCWTINYKNKPAWQWFSQRVKNSKKIRRIIAARNFKYFSAPQKWIYVLPDAETSNAANKNEILLVEEVPLVPYDDNLHAWKTLITREHLDELFAIVNYVGGSSYRPDNVPYTQTGKFAFIDTEYNNIFPNYTGITNFLSPEMAAYWIELTSVH